MLGFDNNSYWSLSYFQLKGMLDFGNNDHWFISYFQLREMVHFGNNSLDYPPLKYIGALGYGIV